MPKTSPDKDGVILEAGDSDKIFSHPEHDYTGQLIATAFHGQFF